MKKLILSMMVISVTVAIHAATVNWMSGAIQTPTSATDGTLSGNKLTSASGFNLVMYAFESTSAISFTAGELYQWYDTDKTAQFKGLTAIAGSVNMSASATTSTSKGVLVPANEGDLLYGAVLFVLEDATSGDPKWYIENSGSIATAKSTKTLTNLALKVGGGTSTVPTAWIAVPADIPEPTSGVLMLLGMAGLALRRRRA